MNNIEILEKMLEREKECLHYDISQNEVQAIKNLIQENKKLLTELQENMCIEDIFKPLYIPKSKVKEKIEAKISCCKAEELEDNYIGDKHSQYWKMYRELLEKLEQELLEEGE